MGRKKRTVQVIPRIHTRKLDRSVAKARMKQEGTTQICKHKKGQSSYFAENWRGYAY